MNEILKNIQCADIAGFEHRADDYTGPDGLVWCGKCHKPHQTVSPFDKKTVLPARCGCEDSAAKEAAHRKMVDKLRADIEKSRFFERGYESFDFARDDVANKEATRICMAYVDKFDEMERESYGLYFNGGVGTGKSFLAGCVVNALLNRGVSALICSSARIISELRSAERDRRLNEALDELNSFRLLVIDDFGVGIEDGNTYNVQLMERLVNERVLCGRPLCITTNIPRKEMLSDNVWLGFKRIYDRVVELCCMPVLLQGDSRRVLCLDERRSACERVLLGGDF